MRLFFSFISPTLLLLPAVKKKGRSHCENQQISRLNIHTDPPTLDARKATDTSSIGMISMCFEGLHETRKKGEIEPATAHQVEISKDNTVYIFHLRKSNWWDGKASHRPRFRSDLEDDPRSKFSFRFC